jgi:hypothetical protein
MKHRWLLVVRDGEDVPEKLSDHLKDESYTNGYDWRKIEYGDGTVNYVCYHNTKEIGFIPIDWADNDQEMDTFWEAADKRGKETLQDLMVEIMDRHSKGR